MKPSPNILALLFAFLMIASIEGHGQPLNYLFKSGEEGYACYRIPAIVTTTQGTLLAFAEARKTGCGDAGDIDLVVRRSTDEGKTWSRMRVVWDDGDNTCGNPAPVVDRQTGEILLLATWNLGADHEKQIVDGTSKDTRRIFLISSLDDGESWSAARELTPDVKKKNWSWYATGPCHGIQVEKGKYSGRLLIPCDHIEAVTHRYLSHVIYSDDHGKSWQLGGSTPQDQVNECTIAEVSRNRLMLNMRNYDRKSKTRKTALSHDGGITWSDLRPDTTLIEPICQASMIAFESGKHKKRQLFFLNPASENKRQNMTLRSSANRGKQWTTVKVLFAGPSAYSDLTRLPGGNPGCLFEAGTNKPYEGIVFQEVAL